MIISSGVVVSVNDETICVQAQRQQACQMCVKGQGCGAGIWSRLWGHKTVQLTFPRDEYPEIQQGQSVRLAVPESTFLKGVAQLYLLPLLGLFLGALLPLAFDPNASEPLLIISGIIGLLTAVTFSRRLSQSAKISLITH